MLELLGNVSEANLGVLQTYETSTDALDPETLDRPDLCFVDGEHTNVACERDAEFCRRAIRDQGLIAFHDVGIVYQAVAAFVARLTSEGVSHRTAYLPDSIFVIELGDSKLLDDLAVVNRCLAAGTGVLWLLESNDRYRALLRARRARVLRRLRLLPRVY